MKQYPEFVSVSLEGPQPILFTGEMVSRTKRERCEWETQI